MKNNILIFPKSNPRIKSELPDKHEVNDNINEMKLYHIQETIAVLSPIIFNQLEIAGFDFSDDPKDINLKDGVFFIETLRSLMCKYYEIYHPIQAIASNALLEDKTEPGTMKIVDFLDIQLKQDETDKVI